MEENKREEQNSPAELMEEEQTPQKWYNNMPDRSCLLFGVAGVYLIYTGYRLCKNVLDGVDGGGMGFMIAGIVFILIGAGMGFLGARGALRNDSLKKAKQAAEERMKAMEPVQKPGMSIKDRASLVSKVTEEEALEEEPMTELSEESETPEE